MTYEEDEKPLTNKELKSLRMVLEHAEQIEAEMKFKAAKKLLWKASRTLILGVSSIIVALAVTWDKVEAAVKWILR